MNLKIEIKRNKNYCLLWCILIVAWLCAAQVLGSQLLILPCLIGFLILSVWAVFNNVTLPVLLFFLPWSTLLKLQQGTMSFFTIALILVCLVQLIKNKFKIIVDYIVIALALFGLTFVSKYAEGYSIDNSYILFIILILLFPLISEEVEKKYSFYDLTVYFALGIVLAALSAQQLVVFPNIARYIDVYTFKSLTRLSGYYGDPNFYCAHITAALGGVLLLILKEKKPKRTLFLIIIAIVLLYCGFLSASKSFIVVMISVMLFWILELLFMRGRISFKLSIILAIGITGIFILSSTVFSDLINVTLMRFENSNDMSSLTTGRTELWSNYINEFLSDIKVLLLGRGFTNVLINSAASHNTIIQIIYQFGLIGMPVLVAWIYCFVRKSFRLCKFEGKILLGTLVLFVGAFGPWMALDIMFFDEFFLIQSYVYVGIRWLGMNNKEISTTQKYFYKKS